MHSTARVVCRETRDADEQAACLNAWQQVYEQLTPGQFVGRFSAVAFRGIQLFREATNKSVHQAGLMCSGERAFGIPVSMSSGYFGGRPVSAETLMTLTGGEELDFRAPENFELVAATVPADTLAQYAWDIDGIDIQEKLYKRRVIVSLHVHHFRNFLVTALESLVRAEALLQHPAMQKALEHAVLSHIVKVLERAADDGHASASCSARHAIVTRAQEYMREHVEEPVTVEDLCRILGVSRRTLQYSFQEVLAVNPVSYLRAIRLSGARRALKSADPGQDSVQDIAARWGFWHLSRFAADYRTMFGELPSETLRTSLANRPA